MLASHRTDVPLDETGSELYFACICASGALFVVYGQRGDTSTLEC